MDTLKEFFEDFGIFGYAIIILIAVIGIVFSDILFSKKEYLNTVVIDKIHEGGSNGTSTGYVINSDGTSGVIVQNTHAPEKYTLTLRLKSGRIISVDCEPELYYSKNQGDNAVIEINIGYLSGIILYYQAIK